MDEEGGRREDEGGRTEKKKEKVMEKVKEKENHNNTDKETEKDNEHHHKGKDASDSSDSDSATGGYSESTSETEPPSKKPTHQCSVCFSSWRCGGSRHELEERVGGLLKQLAQHVCPPLAFAPLLNEFNRNH